MSSDTDVSIEFNEVRCLQNPRGRGVRWAAGDDRFTFQVDRVARYGVQQGSRVLVSPYAGAVKADIEAFFFGTTMAALLLQRKRLALHGGGIATKAGESVLFSGDSGAGKSTLLATFASQGFSLISDDLTSLEVIDNSLIAHQAYPGLKLSVDALRHLRVSPDEWVAIRPGVQKFRVFQDSFFPTGSRPCALIFIETTNESKSRIVKLSRFEGLERLVNNTYRPKFPGALGVLSELFPIMERICKDCALYLLTRPVFGEAPEATVGRVLSELSW